MGHTAVNQMGLVLRVWKLKGRLKRNNPLEEDLIGLANYRDLGAQRSNRGRTAGNVMAPPKEETRKSDNSRGVAVCKG